MDANSSDLERLAIDSSSRNLSFPETFAWDWYIRLKVQFPVNEEADLSTNLDGASKEFNYFWQGSLSKIIHFSSFY